MRTNPGQSAVPRWVRILFGIITASFVIPIVFTILLPYVLAIPLAAPFVFSVFVGDARAERNAARDTIRQYEKSHPAPFWYTPAMPRSGVTR